MSSQQPQLPEFDFALILDGPELTDSIASELYDAGCDDATLSMQYGAIRLEFSRRAESLQQAIITAIQNVHRAKQGLTVLQIDECDLVNQAEIARRWGRSRTLVGQYVAGSRGPGGFPPPSCHLSDTQPLWRWCEVAFWLAEHDLIKREVVHEAQVKATINNQLERLHQLCRNPRLTEEISKSIIDTICCD